MICGTNQSYFSLVQIESRVMSLRRLWHASLCSAGRTKASVLHKRKPHFWQNRPEVGHPFLLMADSFLVHVAHAATVSTGRGSFLLFRNLRDQGFGGEHQAGDGAGIL